MSKRNTGSLRGVLGVETVVLERLSFERRAPVLAVDGAAVLAYRCLENVRSKTLQIKCCQGVVVDAEKVYDKANRFRKKANWMSVAQLMRPVEGRLDCGRLSGCFHHISDALYSLEVRTWPCTRVNECRSLETL